MDDELELEVSDLRTGRAVRKTFDPAPEAPATRDDVGEATADEEASAHVEPLDPARATSQARRSLSRQARGYAVAALTLFVCADILLSLPGPQASIRQALAGPTPTPTATFAPGSDIAYFEQSVPWGTLTLDGKPLFDQQNGQGTTLPPGRHTLTYEATPWALLRCQISVPVRHDDTCPINGGVTYNDQPASRVVELGATPQNLPDAQRAALTSAVANAFQANHETTDLRPGDHYLGVDGAPAIATGPMQATLTLTPNSDPARADATGVPFQCVTFCEVGGGGGGINWMVIPAHVIARWQFATADGTFVQPGASSDLDVIYTLGAQWAGGTWQATLTPYYQGDPGQVCWQAFFKAFPPNGNPLPNANGGGMSGYPGPSAADGCVEVVSPGNNGGGSSSSFATPTPLPADAAIFIARCGVVLAGNDAAHAAQPRLPMASAHEWALAKQWIAQRG